MSLRLKLLALFGFLAVAPLLALSVFQYARSANAIRELLAAQTSAVSRRVASQATDRMEVIRGDLALLAENEETRRFLAGAGSREAASRFVRSAMTAMGQPPSAVVFRDARSIEVLELRSDSSEMLVGAPHKPSWPVLLTITGDDGRLLGSMSASMPIDAIVQRELLSDRVGIGGYTVVVDASGRRVLIDPSTTDRAQAAIDGMDGDAVIDTTAGALRYVEHDSARIASISLVDDRGLAILSAATIGEFSGPINQVSTLNLILALAITGAVALAFFVLAARVTRPIEALTLAAEQVGRGNFDPVLPADGRDEVGRLSAGFRRMSAQVRDMMRQVETSRQMAAVGAFSAQIAHEIRNPLTAIKLNLQSFDRDLRDGSLDGSAHRALEICLSEIQRLDKVVRGVLTLGRGERSPAEPLSVHDALRAAAQLTHDQLAAQGITLELTLAAERDEVLGDAGDLRGVLLNLLLNAADAVERGGRIRVATSVTGGDEQAIQVRVADDGPGVPAAARDTIFEPFYSTKRHGSGLGLAIAARDVESHSGRLSLLEHPGELGGATFVVELPLAPAAERDS